MARHDALLHPTGMVLSAVMIIALLTHCGQRTGEVVAPPEKRTLLIHGAYALYPLALTWAEKYQQTDSTVKIFFFPGSSSKGRTDVEYGMCDIGMYSREPMEGPWAIPVAKDAVVGTVSGSLPGLPWLRSRGISRKELYEVFVTGTLAWWDQLHDSLPHRRIQVFTRSDLSGAAGIWSEYLGVEQEDMQGVGVYGDPGMTTALRNYEYGIGYDNMRYVFDNLTGKYYPGVAPLPIDLDSNGSLDADESFYDSLWTIRQAVRDDSYPLTRNLYFLLDPETENVTALEFVRWCLEEGREMVESSGFVSIADSLYRDDLYRIKEKIRTTKEQ